MMSFNSFRKEFIESNSRSKSPTRVLDAIEFIPESRFIQNLAELLKNPPPPPPQASANDYKQPPHRAPRQKKSTKAASHASSTRRAPPKPSRHSHNNSATFPPLSPIEALATVAVQANSPNFSYPPVFGSPLRGENHVYMSNATITYPAPFPGNTQYGEYSSGVDERPTKRARSELLPSPQQASPVLNNSTTRPATSYGSSFGWTHNLEQIIDSGQRMSAFSPSTNNHPYRQHIQVDNQTRMFEAELLLNLRAGSASSLNGSTHSPETERRTAKDTGDAASSIQTYPFSAPDPARDARLAPAISLPSGQIGSPIEVVPRCDSQVDQTGIPRASPSTQIHTPPEDVLPPPNTREVAVMSKENLVERPSGFLNGNANKEGVAGGRNQQFLDPEGLAISDDIKDGLPAPPKQLQSPQSLLAEPKDLQPSPLISDSNPAPPTGLLMEASPKEWFPKFRERRNSESHLNIPSDERPSGSNGRPSSVPPDNFMASGSAPVASPVDSTQNLDSTAKHHRTSSLKDQATTCASCHWAPNSISEDKVDWLQCNGCQSWYHFACAGFAAKDIRRIDKFYCRSCKGKFGNTTFLRKSTRVHTTVDYAGLNEGVLRPNDDQPEHHYIEPIKENKFALVPESFPRMRAEDVTAEFFTKSISFCEPVLIPAELNPRPQSIGKGILSSPISDPVDIWPDVFEDSPVVDDGTRTVPILGEEMELVPDEGQDGLDMVIPQGLTVRRVAELYGPDNVVPVIDVKSQESESKKWTVGRWADYYESTGDKIIRNVISLEVSQTPFGRLIRRPKIVRDLDLQDSVWPKGETRKSVGFYCLMSVADSYTDFHIDFGGSSVYYHILKGKKVFFFIPPTKSNLQKYEDWNTMSAQNWTWLPDQTKTKECFRVDLGPGDTMLIPSGWIHSVWTPEDSLVIGGNFLTRLHYGTQFRVAEIEKNNKTGLAFRYPKFQKVMWYTVIDYMKEDALPDSVRNLFIQKQQFERGIPAWCEFDKFGHNSDPGPANWHARYYPKAELDGLPEMVSYIFRTVLIHLDCLEGITATSRKAVMDSIPKTVTDPLEKAREFAMWVAWKRGNEDIPQWAHPDSDLPAKKEGDAQKKLNLAQMKKLERAAALPAPERQSARIKTANEISSSPKTSTLGPRRTACDACRKRKMRCKHIPEGSSASSSSGSPGHGEFNNVSPLPGSSTLFGVVIPSPPRQAPQLFNQELHDIPPTVPLPNDNVSLDGSSGQHAETPDAKKGRAKACDECRRSKRRCIHDENGNIDIAKKNEPVIPRGSAKRKLAPGSDSPSGNKLKKEPSTAVEAVVYEGGAWFRKDSTSHQNPLVNRLGYDATNKFSDYPAEVHDSPSVNHQHHQPAELSEPHVPFDEMDGDEPGPSSEPQNGFADLQATEDTVESVLDPALDPALFADSSTTPNYPPFPDAVQSSPKVSSHTVLFDRLGAEPELTHQRVSSPPAIVEVSQVEVAVATGVKEQLTEKAASLVAEEVVDMHDTIILDKQPLDSVDPLDAAAVASEQQGISATEERSIIVENQPLDDVELLEIFAVTPDRPQAEPLTPQMVNIDVPPELSPVSPALSEPPISPIAPPVRVVPHMIDPVLDVSRASSILSDAPSERLQNGIIENTQSDVSLRKRKPSPLDSRGAGPAPKKRKRQSKPPSTILSNGIEPAAESASTPQRISSRHSKPIERLATQQHAELESLNSKRITKQALTPLVNGRPSLGKSTSPEVVRQTPVKTPVKTAVKRKSVKAEVKVEVVMEKNEESSESVAETEEEMSRRVALQLHQSELGLRRRSRGS